MALAERKQIDPSFVESVIEPIQQEAKESQTAGQKSGGRGKKKNSVGKIRQSKAGEKVARLHGTNAKSVSTCEKILAEHPELVDDTKPVHRKVTGLFLWRSCGGGDHFQRRQFEYSQPGRIGPLSSGLRYRKLR